jgi:hypothetical protein
MTAIDRPRISFIAGCLRTVGPGLDQKLALPIDAPPSTNIV